MKYVMSIALISLISFACLAFFVFSAEGGIENIILSEIAEIAEKDNYLGKFSKLVRLDNLDNLDIQVLRNILFKPSEKDEENETDKTEKAEKINEIFEPVYFEVTQLSENTENTEKIDNEADKISRIIISVLDCKTGEIFNIELEDYLTGVVFSEMPASFEFEALKAQAVAARSFSVYKILYSSDEERTYHNGADICNDYRHCKDYLSHEAAVEKYGDIEQFWERIKDAVFETKGEIITYDFEPAVAVFHAMSGNETESAANIWGSAVPYLISVPSEEINNIDNIKNYETQSRFTADEFKSVLASGGYNADFSTDYGTDYGTNYGKWIEDIEVNSSGRVDYVLICGVKIPGTRLRELFALRSTDFTVDFTQSGEFVFTVKGYGHGVGMSQYGANLMALDGKSYIEILKWYYTGTEINFADIFFDK